MRDTTKASSKYGAKFQTIDFDGAHRQCTALAVLINKISIGTGPTERDTAVVIIETAKAIVERPIVAIIVRAGMGIRIGPANRAPVATIRPATILATAGNVLDQLGIC